MNFNEQMNRTACVTWKAQNGNFEVNLRADEAPEAVPILHYLDSCINESSCSSDMMKEEALRHLERLQDVPASAVLFYLNNL